MMIEMGIIIAVITALGEGIKKAGVPKKFMPVVSIVLGVTGGLFFVDGDVANQVFYGVAMGLGASGLFDISKVKNTFGNSKKVKSVSGK
ncbi:hypothetical protein CHL76_02265 [Marinococcus halophilus]|uniref:Holin n=1 Tax=Marinococcus halophilus TaxID=1371 RepID=A0A510Y1H3_MARHA|nr:holin [Marinococcus halophilus]OZT81201.1 hypothetical protein CHL76_02265 [Marinococcus halophilus]GEK57134.1 hypothetical protein MHA01_00390 [Marinococcus halophilus]